MAQRVQIPVLILTGFLGSGKTSLLSKWLRAPEFEGAMVVVNELGEVGLDDRLVQHSSEVPLLLENGCACCEAAEDLNATLERLFWQRLHRQIPPFNWVLIETTGIAEPAALVASLQAHQLVAERYRVHGIVTTFDARRGPAHLKAHGECRSQLETADLVILTKTDIASAAQQAAAIEAIRDIQPAAAILASAKGSVTAGDIIAATNTKADATRARHHGAHTHGRDVGKHHDHAHAHHHAGDYTTAFAPLPVALDWPRLAAILHEVIDAHGANLLRLKGTARIGAHENLEAVQAIAGEDFERAPLIQNAGGKPLRAGLTVIARNTPAETIAADILARLGIAGSIAAEPGLRGGAAAHA